MIVCAACSTSTPPSSTPLTRWIEPPLFDPKAFRIETMLCDVPLDVAKSLRIEPSAHGASIGVRVDETNERKKLDAATDASIRRLERAPVVVEPGGMARVPPRLAPPVPAASDALDIDVRASISYDFAPVQLEIWVAWRDASGRVIARMQGSAPQPKGQWIALTCVPGSGDDRPAIFGFIQAVPIFDAASPFATLDPGEGIDSPRGRLSNTGGTSIRFAVDAARVPIVLELGREGRARWEGDAHTLSVSGGAYAEFVCAGRANALIATMGDAGGGGRIVILGFENRCTNVPNGFARTTFESRPGSGARGRRNELDVDAESGNVVEGAWDETSR